MRLRFAALLAAASPSLCLAQTHPPIVIDGQPSDWIGQPSTGVHSVAIDQGEWIYTGAPLEARTDLGDDPDINNGSDAADGNGDLTEMRMALTDDSLCVLVRLRDITDVARPSFALGVDTNAPGDADSITFLGDEANVFLDEANHTWDFSTQVHVPSSAGPQVEIFDDVGDQIWFTPEGSRAAINAETDCIEFSIPRTVLGLTAGSPHSISIQAAIFENQLGEDQIAWNNDRDSTRAIGAGPDALDVLGGKPGVAVNSWERVFADSLALDSRDPGVHLIFNIGIPAEGLGLTEASALPQDPTVAALPDTVSEIGGAGAQAIAWQEDLEAARQAAAAQHRPLLVNFVTERSRNARRMEAETWANGDVIAAVGGRFVPVRIFMERNQALAADLGVFRSPTVLILQPGSQGSPETDRIDGFATSSDLLGHLQ